jgi:hypothetical protein
MIIINRAAYYHPGQSLFLKLRSIVHRLISLRAKLERAWWRWIVSLAALAFPILQGLLAEEASQHTILTP